MRLIYLFFWLGQMFPSCPFLMIRISHCNTFTDEGQDENVKMEMCCKGLLLFSVSFGFLNQIVGVKSGKQIQSHFGAFILPRRKALISELV